MKSRQSRNAAIDAYYALHRREKMLDALLLRRLSVKTKHFTKETLRHERMTAICYCLSNDGIPVLHFAHIGDAGNANHESNNESAKSDVADWENFIRQEKMSPKFPAPH